MDLEVCIAMEMKRYLDEIPTELMNSIMGNTSALKRIWDDIDTRGKYHPYKKSQVMDQGFSQVV